MIKKILLVIQALRVIWGWIKWLRDWFRRRRQGFTKAMIQLFLNRKKRFGR